MALLNTFTDSRTGLTVPNAYYVATTTNWDKRLNVASASISVYVSQAMREANLISGSIGELTVRIPNADTSIDEVYVYLKTLPDFADAVDA